MRPGALAALLALSALALGAAPASGPVPRPLPARMADTGGGTQLITAVAPGTASTTGTVSWWDRRGGRWTKTGSAPARFGAKGLADGATRTQSTNTTPTGLYDLPYAFGIQAPPRGTAYPYRPVREDSWWCQDNVSRAYNRWTEPLPADCRATEAEHLITYPAQYAHALVGDGRLRVGAGGRDAPDPAVGRPGGPAAHRDRHVGRGDRGDPLLSTRAG
jgi:hypothetical protein